jgi:GTPase SAR1 family protein
MKKVAVFGNSGGGKSTLARRLAEVTGLPLYPVDSIQFKAGGVNVPHEEYLKINTDLLSRAEWIIDGFGSTLNSNRVLWLCHRGLPPRYRQLVVDAAASKRVHHLKSPADVKAFLQAVQREYRSRTRTSG